MTIQSIEDVTLDAFPDLSVHHERRPDHLQADWPANHLSASALKQWFRCREQFRRRRILGEKEPPAGAIVWGTAHHAALEQNWLQKVESHADLPGEELATIFAARVDEEVERAGGSTEVDWGKSKEWRSKEPRVAHAEVKDRGVALVRLAREQVTPRVQPLTVEQPFQVHIPGTDVPLVGYIDIDALIADPLAQLERAVNGQPIEQLDPLARRETIDQKTAGRAGISNESRFQAYTYQLARPQPVGFHLALKTKSGRVLTPDDDPAYLVDLAPATRTIRMVQLAMVEIAFYYSVIGPDRPWSPGFGGFADVCGYCGFGPTGSGACPWWRDDWPERRPLFPPLPS